MNSPRKETAKFIPTILLKACKDDRQIVFEPNTSTVLFNWTRSAFFTLSSFIWLFRSLHHLMCLCRFSFLSITFISVLCTRSASQRRLGRWVVGYFHRQEIQHFLRCSWTTFPSISCSFSYFWLQSIAAIKRKIFIYQNKRSQLCKSLWQSSIPY